jgi:hypothetical protein
MDKVELISAVETNRGGILMKPRGLDLVDLQSPKGNGAEDLMQMGIKESIERLTQTRTMEGAHL